MNRVYEYQSQITPMMSQKTTYDIISQSISEIWACESSVQISKSAKAYNESEDHLQYDKPENNPQ